MRAAIRIALIATALAMLGGCLAKTALDVVTLPAKAVSKGIDAVTTSQSEADEKRGRALRKQQERLGKLERTYSEQLANCRAGDRRACSDAQGTYAEIQLILPTIPLGPDG